MKHALFHKLKISSAQNRVVMICICFMLIAMLIIGIYMSIMMYMKSAAAIEEKMQIYTDKTVENLDQSFSYVSNTALAVATSQSILSWFYNPQIFDEASRDYYQQTYALKNEINHIMTYSNAWQINYISYIAVFVDSKLLVYAYTKPLPENAIVTSSRKAYEYIKNNSTKYVNDLRPFLNDNKIYHIREMKHNFTQDTSLMIMVVTDEAALRAQYSNSLETGHMVTYLVDEDGAVFSSSDVTKRGLLCDPAIKAAMNDHSREIKIDGKSYLFMSKALTNSSLTFINLVPKDYIMQQSLSGLPLYIIISLILCVILLGLGSFVSFRSTRFISQFAHCMERVKDKDYDVKMPPYNNYAIDFLGDSFNDMTLAMKTLVKDTYESKILLQATQLEFLQQQVNPHFLFNILLTIQIKAKLCSDETVYHMLTSLSGFLRAGLYANDNTFTTLGEELQCVTFYLYLQQQRFDGRLDYQIQVPEELMNLELPRLTIEPIVENAIVHGMEGQNNLVKVTITAAQDEKDIVITVNDDGVGFSPADLSMHRSGSNSSQPDKIGLKNTNERLILLYGDAYALSIKSQKGLGTQVIIRIPQKEAKE